MSWFFVNSYSLWTACWGFIVSLLLIKFNEFFCLHFWICSHHFEICCLLDLYKFNFFLFIVFVILLITSLTSPTKAKSTLIILLIDDGSISMWTFLDFGENSSIFPVILSSNLAPILISKSQSVSYTHLTLPTKRIV